MKQKQKQKAADFRDHYALVLIPGNPVAPAVWCLLTDDFLQVKLNVR